MREQCLSFGCDFRVPVVDLSRSCWSDTHCLVTSDQLNCLCFPQPSHIVAMKHPGERIHWVWWENKSFDTEMIQGCFQAKLSRDFSMISEIPVGCSHDHCLSWDTVHRLMSFPPLLLGYDTWRGPKCYNFLRNRSHQLTFDVLSVRLSRCFG